VEKVDSNGLPLANAEFELRTVGGQLVQRGVTNQGGILVFEGLETGTFTLSETRPPAGFLVVEHSQVIEFTAGESRVECFVKIVR